MFSLVMFPAQLPQPRLSVQICPLYQLPVLTRQCGMLHSTRPTFARIASSSLRPCRLLWRETEWPIPENSRIFSRRLSISFQSFHFHTVRTRLNFSPEKRS